jgi:hypothetical protein
VAEAARFMPPQGWGTYGSISVRLTSVKPVSNKITVTYKTSISHLGCVVAEAGRFMPPPGGPARVGTDRVEVLAERGVKPYHARPEDAGGPLGRGCGYGLQILRSQATRGAASQH